MREFEPVQLGLKNKMGIKKNTQPIDTNLESYYRYPRSYYSSMKLRPKDIIRDDHEIPTRGSGKGFYEIIPQAFNKSQIRRSGGVHAEDFDYSSKIVDRYPTMKARKYDPPEMADHNLMRESGAPIGKK